MTELAFTNATIVLADEVITGSVLVRDGEIAAIDTGSVHHGEDLGGEYLIPGLVELHTDHFEHHYRPRQGVTWNALAALQAHDAQVAGAGITTVFDAVRIGSDPETGDITEDVNLMVEAVAHADADDRLRADHHIHLRCELATPDVAERVCVALMSTPTAQFRTNCTPPASSCSIRCITTGFSSLKPGIP